MHMPRSFQGTAGDSPGSGGRVTKSARCAGIAATAASCCGVASCAVSRCCESSAASGAARMPWAHAACAACTAAWPAKSGAWPARCSGQGHLAWIKGHQQACLSGQRAGAVQAGSCRACLTPAAQPARRASHAHLGQRGAAQTAGRAPAGPSAAAAAALERLPCMPSAAGPGSAASRAGCAAGTSDSTRLRGGWCAAASAKLPAPHLACSRRLAGWLWSAEGAKQWRCTAAALPIWLHRAHGGLPGPCLAGSAAAGLPGSPQGAGAVVRAPCAFQGRPVGCVAAACRSARKRIPTCRAPALQGPA